MGGANEICTDKTGTLTQNRMTVMTIFTENAITDGIKYADLADRQVCETLCQSVAWNCSAFVETEANGEKVCKGNVTEVGMLNYLMNSGVDVEQYIRDKDGKMEMQIPFDSKRKR
jgi:P-type E1-E2 ATPase